MKYVLTSPKLQGKILFEFALNGYLKSFVIDDESDVNEKLLKFIFQHFPIHENVIRSQAFTSWFKVENAGDDLSFGAFWEAYGYKVGDKKRSQKLWEALTDADRALALAACKRYKGYLANKPNMDQAYPETWLKQRRFENQFN